VAGRARVELLRSRPNAARALAPPVPSVPARLAASISRGACSADLGQYTVGPETAGSATSMQETLQALLNLQEIDREIFRTQAELKRLPTERQARRGEFEKRIARLAEIKTEGKVLRVRIKEIEDATTTQRQRVRKVENEAASSRQDMALLAAYQHEIRSLKREIGNSEEEGLQLVERVEGIEAQAAALQSEIEAEQKIFQEFSSNVEREFAVAQNKLSTLEAERKKRLSKEIPPESLAIYTRLLAAREGVALAELDGRVCQGCFMEMPTNLCVRVARATELVQCPSCDRILFPAPM
jgi:predicted  nucleic acid-binding Zn-ribbon protein